MNEKNDYIQERDELKQKHQEYLYKLNPKQQIDDLIYTKYEDKFCQLQVPHQRKEELKRLHED